MSDDGFRGGGHHRTRTLTTRVTTLAAVIVCGPPLLLLLVLSGVTAAPTGPARLTGELPTGPVGPLPTTMAASDAQQVAAVPVALRGDFLAAARAYALPPALLAAIGDVESGFTPSAVGPPVPGGPAEGMMQFLPSSWVLFNAVPGATPFDPGPAVLAAARHLLSSGALPGGGFDATAALFGYNHSHPYGQTVLALAARFGYRYDPDRPPDDPVRYHYPLARTATAVAAGPGGALVLDPATGPGGRSVLACVRAAVVSVTRTGTGAGSEVVLRGEDGFLYAYRGLAGIEAAVRPGVVVNPGTSLGAAGPALDFGIRHDADAAAVDPRPYLEVWPQTSGASGTARTAVAAVAAGAAARSPAAAATRKAGA